MTSHLFYPALGICISEGVKDLPVKMAKLRSIDTGIICIIPLARFSELNIRPLVGLKDIEPLKAIMYSQVDMPSKLSAKRLAKYKAALSTGQLELAAKVYRDLTSLRRVRDLNFDENSLLDRSYELLFLEFDLVMLKNTIRLENSK